MKTTIHSCRFRRVLSIVTALATAACCAVGADGLGPDTLYIGDGGNNTVKRFDLTTGASLDGAKGAFVTHNSAALRGPRGLLIAGGNLIIVNQNAGQPVNGELLAFRLKSGTLSARLVPKRDPNSPFLPRGAVLRNGVFYVANFGKDNVGSPGSVLVFSGDGTLLGDLVPPGSLAASFRPRGVVTGPDGLLYVSSVPNFPEPPPGSPGLGGRIFRFNPITLQFVDLFVDDVTGGVGQLNRPEGIGFGPDGNLYVASFRANPSDTDSIRIYNGATGAFVGKLDLYGAGQPRAFAQALLFGPGGKLLVPISGGAVGNAAIGEVRSYDIATKSYTVLVPAGTLTSPQYLTFGRTNSATLGYDE